MAQQFINIGIAPNDGSGDQLRDAFDKINDNDTELYADIATLQGTQITAADLIRSAGTEAATGTTNQVISFSSQFVTTYNLIIMDYTGAVGIEVTAQDEDGFTIDSLSAGNFGYLAIVEQ